MTVANHLGSRGGLERTQLTNCRELAARGHSVCLVYVSDGDFTLSWQAFTEEMVKIRGTLPGRRAPVSSSLALLSALKTGISLAPEVTYVYRYWDLPYAAVLRLISGTPIVYHVCLPPPSRLPGWLRAAIRRVDSTVAVSRDTATRWSSIGLRPEDTTIALTAVDLDYYKPATPDVVAATRRELGLQPDEFVVIYAGRIDRTKGVDVLVSAFRRLVEKEEECHLLVVGSASLGSDPADSELYSRELTESTHGLPVSWLGGRSDVLRILQSADVAVVPSLLPDSLPRSVLEPLACGVPVVASRTGGTPEVLTGWLSSHLFEPGDEAGLTARLLQLRHWRQRDSGLGERCRRVAEERLSLDSELDMVEGAMRRTVERNHRRHVRRTSSARWERS